MAPKAHGTSDKPVQKNLKWNVDMDTADRITNFNRRFAEYGGYWKQTDFLKEVSRTEPTTYYDSVTGKPLFRAPIGRSMEDFLAESNVHGWPSFRDQEVVWENTRILRDGETVSVSGTHRASAGLLTSALSAPLAHSTGRLYESRSRSRPQPTRPKWQPLLHQPGQHRRAPGGQLRQVARREQLKTLVTRSSYEATSVREASRPQTSLHAHMRRNRLRHSLGLGAG